MRWMWMLTAAGLLVGCESEQAAEEAYSEDWSADAPALAGKADLVDLAPEVAFGDTVTGQVDSKSLDIFQIKVQRGDRFQVLKRVKSGDLSPDFILFENARDAVRSDEFKVTRKSLFKEYTVPSTGTYILVVRAFRHRGEGQYSLEVACVGGPCNGEFPEPEPEEPMDVSDAASCIDDARQCALKAYRDGSDAPGEELFQDCLGSVGTFDGGSCLPACAVDEDAEDICVDVARSVENYRGRDAACYEIVDDCMDVCTGDNFGADELWSSPEMICWLTGFNGDCNFYATSRTECGGIVEEDTLAECHLSCLSTIGAWNDDLDVICEEDCGDCDEACQEVLDNL